MNISRRSSSRQWQVVVAFSAFWLIFSNVSLSETLWVVRQEWPDELAERYSRSTIIVDTLSEKSGTIAKVWSLPDGQCYVDLKLYPEARVILLETAFNPANSAEKVFVIPFDSVQSAVCLDVKALGWVRDCRFLRTTFGSGRLEVVHLPGAFGKWQEQEVRTIIDIRSKQVVDAVSASAEDPRPPGEGVAFGSEGTELVRVRVDSDGTIRTGKDSMMLNGTPVPANIISRKSSYGWNQIANEPRLRLLESIADRGDYTDRELLIYDRVLDSWSSTLVPGISTSMQYLNGWVYGVIADDPPGVDYVNRHGGSPILREDVVFVDPIAKRQFVEHIGPDPRILWFEGNTVYYQTGEELYQAGIGEDGFSERKLLLRAPYVADIRWAFVTR